MLTEGMSASATFVSCQRRLAFKEGVQFSLLCSQQEMLKIQQNVHGFLPSQE